MHTLLFIYQFIKDLPKYIIVSSGELLQILDIYLSFSLSLYIYIYMCVCVCVIYIYTQTHTTAQLLS